MLKLKLKNNEPLNMSEKEDLEGTGTQSFLQPKEAGKTVKMTSEKNPHALALDAAYGNDNPVDAKGNFSAVFGSASRAEGKRAFAQGTNTFAKGNYSHSEGDNAVAHGTESHAEGYNTLSQGNQSHAEGNDTISKGLSAHAEGISTVAEGNYSHSEGNQSKAGGEGSHSEGINTEAAGYYSHAEGENSKVLTALPADGGTSGGSTGGDPSGETWKPSEHLGQKGHVEGTNNLVLGYSAHAEGYNTKAYGPISHAEGYNTIAGTKDNLESGWCAHASGRDTVASFDYSTTMGLGTVANTECETVVGKYNRGLHSLFNVGCGTSQQRDSAFVVAINGDSVFTKNLTVYKNLTVNTDLTVKGIIKCDEIASISTTEHLKLPSIWVGGDIDATNNTITAKTLKCDKITPATLGITSVDIPECSITTCVVSSDITVPLIRGIDDESGDPTPIEIENPINVTGGGTNSFVGGISCESVTSRTACMTSAVGADKAAFNQNDIVTFTYDNTKVCYMISQVANSSITGSGDDIAAGGDPLMQGLIKGLFNGFVALELAYYNSTGNIVYTYQLPGISYFNEKEAKTIQIPLPSFDPDNSIGSTGLNTFTYINEGKLVFDFAKTADTITTPSLYVGQTFKSNDGTGLYSRSKIKFWNSDKFIDITKITIRLRKFN